MFPFTIIENFFPDPDKIVEIAKSVEYTKHEEDTNYAGARSENFHVILPDLHQYICTRILQPFFSGGDGNEFVSAEAEIGFQIINPLHEDQYHPKNCGWIHKDSTTLFAGLIYLNRVPEPDTGTDIYIEKDGYAWTEDEDTKIEHKHYSGEEVLDEDYIKAYNRVNGQYELSISFKNVFNRMIAYDSQVSHCARTFGKDQERLTLTFFFKDLIGSQPPGARFG